MATRSNAPKLVDVMTRHQIYLEGLKDNYGKEFDATVQLLRRDLRAIFFDIEEDRLDKLTKRELERFIRLLRTAQIKHFSTYTQQVLNDLREFTAVDTEVNVEIMRETQEDDKTALALLAALLTAKKQKQLWARINSLALPANGMAPPEMLAAFVATGTASLEQTVRRAHANRMRVADALRLVLGSARLNNRDGLLTRYAYQARGIVATLLQHVAGVVQADTGSIYYPRYQWVAVLDSRTSDICASRHGRVYRYGEGPLPPAHPNCRSKTVPVDGEADVPESYYDWLRAQPAEVQDDILGERRAGSLRAGSLRRSDLAKFNDASPLTLTKFKGKLRQILAK